MERPISIQRVEKIETINEERGSFSRHKKTEPTGARGRLDTWSRRDDGWFMTYKIDHVNFFS